MELMKGRTKAIFFSIMRPRLFECDPIKYSCRQTLENDLRILAAACNHEVLRDNGSDLEEMITKTRRGGDTVAHLFPRENNGTRLKNNLKIVFICNNCRFLIFSFTTSFLLLLI